MAPEQAQALLPEGWTPLEVLPGRAVFVVNFFHCDGGFAWAGADMFTIVEPPTLPDVVETFDAGNRTPRSDADDVLALDLYMLAAHPSTVALARIFDRGGIPNAPGNVTKHANPTPTGSLATGRLTDADGVVMSYTVAGRDLEDVAAHHRQWRETDEGLLLVERVLTDAEGRPLHITQGAAQCEVRAGSLFAEFLDGATCALGQDLPDGLVWSGGAYIFPGIRGG